MAASNAFAWALSALLHDVPAASPKLPGCRAAIERDADLQMDTVERQLTGSMPTGADKLLRNIDARYGGLAAPRSVELANRLAHLQAPSLK